MPPRTGKKPTMKSQLALLSNIISRAKLASRMAGSQYGGLRDIYTAAGYIEQGKVTFDHYWGMYTRGDIAGRIVDMPAKTTWRTPPLVSEEDQPEGTKFTDEFETLAKRLKLWRYFGRLDRLAGVGRYAVLMIGTKGGEDSTLKLPLERVKNADDLLYLSVYHEKNAAIETWETDVTSPRYGLPKTYKLRISDNLSNLKAQDLVVHASRVIHAAENLLEDDVFGRPRLERVLNRLFDLDKVAASTGEAYWQSVSRILQAKMDPAAEVTDAQLKDLDEKLGEMVHDLRRQFSGQGVGLEWLGNETPNVHEVADFYFSLIAGASGIPKRILFGSEVGELASTTDQQTYMGMINERQEDFAEPMILRAFIDRMIDLKALTPPKDGEYMVEWPTLFEETADDQAAANLKRAQTAAALTPVGGDPMTLVEVDEDRNVWLIKQEPAIERDPELFDPNIDDPGLDGTAATGPADTSTGPTGPSGPTG